MKSLEIANEYRNITVKSMNEYIDNCDKYGQEINECYFNMLEEQLAHFDIIKQDLEVLEILRKNLYIHTSYGDSDYGEYEDKSICINEIHECFCKEDYNKVKQWLEENKDENI